MIVSQSRGFYFIHIPKNGGSSVRDQIQPIDDNEGLFLGTKMHPVLGRLDSSHVPLVWLREYWPEQFETLQALKGYAILRDPHERFISSVAQRFRFFRNKTPTELTPQEIEDEISVVIDHLEQAGRFPEAKFSHFMRQSEFVQLDGTQIVDHLYRLSDIDLLIKSITKTSGLDLKANFHSNKTFELRYKWLNTPLQRSKDIAKKVLPPRYLDIVRQKTIKALAKPQGTTLQSIVSGSDRVHSFVSAYYAEDLALFRATPSRR